MRRRSPCIVAVPCFGPFVSGVHTYTNNTHAANDTLVYRKKHPSMVIPSARDMNVVLATPHVSRFAAMLRLVPCAAHAASVARSQASSQRCIGRRHGPKLDGEAMQQRNCASEVSVTGNAAGADWYERATAEVVGEKLGDEGDTDGDGGIQETALFDSMLALLNSNEHDGVNA
ncbi:hypothetical protein E2562_038591 [Oryza meyeriana var. granulata]|uniref:Uncharacterized protein n=1 Tax=Oryza meyeriana var. granulata TaxID=110450 RepID=A0A6G1DVQ0_9ORYZ|nr:hypothetical protein E2562_038591 [Oryza meyeriana var. granulata]